MNRQNGTTAEFTDNVIPLLIEYEGKLDRLFEKLKTISKEEKTKPARDAKSIHEIEKYMHWQLERALASPARALAEQVSQQIEHGRLDPLKRLELRLRLAEFESLLFAVNVLSEGLYPKHAPAPH